ncbi:MAG: hypothetical protein Q4C96_10685 [Planctomycetia bacterium]|nr:hypothetical protein [Planctomycetia bacterium]
MFLADPEHTPYDVRFQIFGIPVRIHPFFWLMMLFLGGGVGPAQFLILFIVAAFLSLMVHELGHALAMKRYGIYSSITLYAFGGMTIPFRMHYPSQIGARDRAFISFAGAGAQYILAFFIALLYALMFPGEVSFGLSWNYFWQFLAGPASGGFGFYVDLLFYFLFRVSIIWSTLNLLPILPLDGGNILKEFLVWLFPRQGMVYTVVLSIFCAVFLAVLAFKYGMYFAGIFLLVIAYSNYQILSPRRPY